MKLYDVTVAAEALATIRVRAADEDDAGSTAAAIVTSHFNERGSIYKTPIVFGPVSVLKAKEAEEPEAGT